MFVVFPLTIAPSECRTPGSQIPTVGLFEMIGDDELSMSVSLHLFVVRRFVCSSNLSTITWVITNFFDELLGPGP
jgi:hypothetical protein